MKIAPLEKNQIGESAKPVYEALEKKLGRVLNFFKVIAYKPNVLGPFVEFYGQVWAPGALSPKIKELAYLRTSIMNGCEY